MNRLTAVFFTAFWLMVCSLNASAQDQASDLNIQSLLIHIVKNNEEIKSFNSKVEQARAQYSKAVGLYYPTLELTADAGKEKIEKEYASDTSETRYDAGLRLNQLITDFGKTSNTIKRSSLLLNKAELELGATSQKLMLDGIKAYIDIIKARERLKYALQSEKRIKDLTGIEETLVKKKAGLSSDVLQAKSQLAGAKALKVSAIGDLKLARNHFYTVFSKYISDYEVAGLKDMNYPEDKLPLNMEEAVDRALKKNPELLISKLDTDIARKDVSISKTAFYPELNFFGEAAGKEDDAGVLGYRNEYAAGVELRCNFINGGRDIAQIKSARASRKASNFHSQYISRIIQEQVNNSWEQFLVLKKKADLLKEQADIVENFLILAKKERKMGTRSLLDVLNGEINYINSVADYISARQDTKAAAFNLIYAMGEMDLNLFEQP